jgi:hypothetical protein
MPLCLGDAVVSPSDLALIQSPTSWLNDSCMLVFLEHLRINAVPASATHTCVLPPGACLLLAALDAEELLVPNSPDNLFVRARTSSLVLVPVSNSSLEQQAAGKTATGSHWSLLAVRPQQHAALHFDSAANLNLDVAGALLRPLERVLGTNLRLSSARCPQQTNGYDCGAWVLAFCQTLVEGKDVETGPDPGAVRDQLRELVRQLQQS